MNTFLAWCRLLSPIATAVSASLSHTYGKYAWFAAVVAGAGAIALIAPTVLPSKAETAPAIDATVKAKAAAYDALQTKG